MYIDEELLGIYPSQNTVFYFENLEHDEYARKPHYHIAIKTNEDRYILLVSLPHKSKKESNTALSTPIP